MDLIFFLSTSTKNSTERDWAPHFETIKILDGSRRPNSNRIGGAQRKNVTSADGGGLARRIAVSPQFLCFFFLLALSERLEQDIRISEKKRYISSHMHDVGKKKGLNKSMLVALSDN